MCSLTWQMTQDTKGHNIKSSQAQNITSSEYHKLRISQAQNITKSHKIHKLAINFAPCQKEKLF